MRKTRGSCLREGGGVRSGVWAMLVAGVLVFAGCSSGPTTRVKTIPYAARPQSPPRTQPAPKPVAAQPPPKPVAAQPTPSPVISRPPTPSAPAPITPSAPTSTAVKAETSSTSNPPKATTPVPHPRVTHAPPTLEQERQAQAVRAAQELSKKTGVHIERAEGASPAWWPQGGPGPGTGRGKANTLDAAYQQASKQALSSTTDRTTPVEHASYARMNSGEYVVWVALRPAPAAPSIPAPAPAPAPPPSAEPPPAPAPAPSPAPSNAPGTIK